MKINCVEALLLVVLVLVLAGCAVKENLSDGYQAGDITEGSIDNYHLYCSAPFVTVRALGRFIVLLFGGVTVPDLCSVVEKAIENSGVPSDSGSEGGGSEKKVLPGTL